MINPADVNPWEETEDAQLELSPQISSMKIVLLFQVQGAILCRPFMTLYQLGQFVKEHRRSWGPLGIFVCAGYKSLLCTRDSHL